MVPMICGMGDAEKPFVVTPGAIRAEQDTVNGAVHALDYDIAGSNAVSSDFVDAWALWRDGWDHYYADQGGVGGWFGRIWGASYEKTLEYRQALEAWRAQFLAQGGRTAGPGLPPTPKSPDIGGAAKDVTRNIAIAVGIAAALWVAHTAYKEVRR